MAASTLTGRRAVRGVPVGRVRTSSVRSWTGFVGLRRLLTFAFRPGGQRRRLASGLHPAPRAFCRPRLSCVFRRRRHWRRRAARHVEGDACWALRDAPRRRSQPCQHEQPRVLASCARTISAKRRRASSRGPDPVAHAATHSPPGVAARAVAKAAATARRGSPSAARSSRSEAPPLDGSPFRATQRAKTKEGASGGSLAPRSQTRPLKGQSAAQGRVTDHEDGVFGRTVDRGRPVGLDEAAPASRAGASRPACAARGVEEDGLHATGFRKKSSTLATGPSLNPVAESQPSPPRGRPRPRGGGVQRALREPQCELGGDPATSRQSA
jgi:hypothetical protein